MVHFLNCKGFTGKLVIPNSVTEINGGAFLDCSGLTGDLIIPDGVTSIDEMAFGFCYNLSGKVFVPDSVISIASDAFCYWDNPVVIYGYECSYAQTYASENNYEFVAVEKLAITSQPSNFTGEIGGAAKFTIEANGVKSYQWQQNTGSGWVNINTSAGRSSTITVQATAARDGFMYRCVVSDGTNSITSNEVVLNV